MRWQPLGTFADRSVGKLWNLRRARRGGLAVPPTVWAAAADLERTVPGRPAELGVGPLIVRSASPAEDADAGTAAGRFESVVVHAPGDGPLRTAVERVVRSLRTVGSGPLGAVFVQPLLAPELGGVAFTDGFYWERTLAPGGNRTLTAGTERGRVERGHLERGEPWSTFLEQVARVFADMLARGAALDLEFAVDRGRHVLLQARPARFPLRRNPLLSQANHREILGDLPSPWITAALERSGSRALDYFARVDPAVRGWGESYAVVVAGRPWLNFSFFYRLMDRWGLPRAFVTDGVGGGSGGALDRRANLPRMVVRSPRLVRLQVQSLLTVARSRRAVARFARAVEAARDLPALFDATVLGLDVALTTNFALNGALTGLERVRRALGVRGRAEVVTEALMAEFEELRELDGIGRPTAFARWLRRYGHRGPLESDPARPRFAELAGVLRAQLDRDAPARRGERERAPARGGPLFWLDRRRESFRDDLMRVWSDLRARILALAADQCARGRLDSAEDVFLLSRDELARLDAGAPDLAPRRAERARLGALALPHTAHREALEAAAEGGSDVDRAGELRGAGLGEAQVRGRVLRAGDLVELLEREAAAEGPLLDGATVLVAPALEPSWAVVFGRVGAVVTELGGELSHVAILLREAGVPAVLNVPGAFSALRDGEQVLVDAGRGRVERLELTEGAG